MRLSGRQQPERVEQEGLKKLLRAMGARFWVAGTTRKQGDHPGTMMTPGLPDFPLVFLPRHRKADYQPADGPAWELVCVEMKSPKAAKTKNGGLRPEQEDLRTQCLLAGVPYVHGCLDDVIDWLIRAGYLRASQFPHYRVAKPPEQA